MVEKVGIFKKFSITIFKHFVFVIICKKKKKTFKKTFLFLNDINLYLNNILNHTIVIGTLRGFDSLVNLVLDDCKEYLRGERIFVLLFFF